MIKFNCFLRCILFLLAAECLNACVASSTMVADIRTAEELRTKGFELANLSKKDQNLQNSLNYLLRSLDLEPHHAKAARTIGRLYYLDEKYEKAEKYLKKALEVDDGNALTWNNLGWVYGKQKQFSKMRDAFLKAIANSQTEDAWNYKGLGEAYYNLRQYDKAEEHFKKALQIKDIQEVNKHLGFVLFKKNNLNESEKYLNKYIDSFSEKHVAYRNIGRSFWDQEYYEEAEKYLKKALEIENGYAMAWNNLGWIYDKQEKYSKMRDAFEKASKYDASEPWNFYGLGVALYKLQQYDLAEVQFRKALELKEIDDAHYMLGFLYFKRKNLAESDKYFNKYIDSYTDKQLAYNNIGRFFWKQDHYDEAEKYLQKAVELDEKYALAWNNLGWVYENKYQYSKMRDAFEKAIKHLEVADSWYYIGLGHAYYHLQVFDLAIVNYNKALNSAETPDEKPNAFYGLGKVSYRKGNYNEATKYFHLYIESKRAKHEAYKRVGRFYYIYGRLETAEKYIRNAINTKPDYAAAWNNLGWLYWKKSDYRRMKSAFEKALSFQKNKEEVYNRIGLGLAYFLLGDINKAENVLHGIRRALKNSDEIGSYNDALILIQSKQRKYDEIERIWQLQPTLGLHHYIENDEAVVHYLEKGHLADLAGLKTGDRIVFFDGKPLIDNGSLENYKKKLNYGDKIPLVVRRNDSTIELSVVLDYAYYLERTFYLLKESADTTPPHIRIDEPDVESRGIKVVSSIEKEITVRGTATDDSGIFEIVVNNREASFSPEGNFWIKVPLVYGDNRIVIKACDGMRNSVEKEFTIIRKTRQDDLESSYILKRIDPFGRYYALLIGIQEYTYESVNDLEHPISDALRLKELLQEQYTFDANRIEVLKNPDRKAIIKALDELAERIESNDNLLIFYAGHGYWDERFNQGYWLPSDANWKDRSGWISNSTISDYLRGINARHTLLLSDACFSGGIFRTKGAFNTIPKAVEEIYKLPSRKAITSGAMETVPDQSIFVKYMLKRLRENPDKYLNAQKLFTSMREAVINNSVTNQKPLYGVIHQTGDEGGDFIFVRK